jgi:hypothetical protein
MAFKVLVFFIFLFGKFYDFFDVQVQVRTPASRVPLCEGVRGSWNPPPCGHPLLKGGQKNPRPSRNAMPWMVHTQKFGLENYPPSINLITNDLQRFTITFTFL